MQYACVLTRTWVFLFSYIFAVRPYYRYTMDSGAQLLTIRTGLLAFACIPILIALAGKANVMTLLTGCEACKRLCKYYLRRRALHFSQCWMMLVTMLYVWSKRVGIGTLGSRFWSLCPF